MYNRITIYYSRGGEWNLKRIIWKQTHEISERYEFPSVRFPRARRKNVFFFTAEWLEEMNISHVRAHTDTPTLTRARVFGRLRLWCMYEWYTIIVYDMYKILRQKKINMMYNTREFVANRYIIKFERYNNICVCVCVYVFLNVL